MSPYYFRRRRRTRPPSSGGERRAQASVLRQTCFYLTTKLGKVLLRSRLRARACPEPAKESPGLGLWGACACRPGAAPGLALGPSGAAVRALQVGVMACACPLEVPPRSLGPLPGERARHCDPSDALTGATTSWGLPEGRGSSLRRSERGCLCGRAPAPTAASQRLTKWRRPRKERPHFVPAELPAQTGSTSGRRAQSSQRPRRQRPLRAGRALGVWGEGGAREGSSRRSLALETTLGASVREGAGPGVRTRRLCVGGGGV